MPSHPSPAAMPAFDPRQVLPLVFSQLAVNAAMAGQRMAAPLQALDAGHAAWSVGVLLALFTALPVLTAMAAGRLADRRGYHHPLRLAVALTVCGAALALAACWLPSGWQFGLLCLAAAASGTGANICGIATQRTGGQFAVDTTSRLRIFSWLGMAPAFASAVGPVLAGVMIDVGGYSWAYAAMMGLPLLSLWFARGVAQQGASVDQASAGPRGTVAELLAVPGLRRLLFVNWLLSASWDIHSFAVPVLGHARDFNASTIGVVLATFTLAVTVVRFIVPLLAHRVDEIKLLCSAMLVTGSIFLVYPFATTPLLMSVCAALLGLTLGAVQPTVVTALYHLSPAGRHGETIAFRSMAISVSNSVMPLAFGAAGTVLGPGVMFWIMGTLVASNSWVPRGLRAGLGRP